jgi:hypothetical protein
MIFIRRNPAFAAGGGANSGLLTMQGCFLIQAVTVHFLILPHAPRYYWFWTAYFLPAGII